MAGPLIFAAHCSLDGYFQDEHGKFDFTVPTPEIHAFINDGEREIGTYLYGRKLYETMAIWETLDLTDQSPEMRDYALIWRAADKIIFSRTLERVWTPRTRLERAFDPEAVAELKARSETPLEIGGPELAAGAFRAGLVDEIRLWFSPVIVGGGRRALPDGLTQKLELIEHRRFDDGTILVRYSVA